jgi:hypothetical protein
MEVKQISYVLSHLIYINYRRIYVYHLITLKGHMY